MPREPHKKEDYTPRKKRGYCRAGKIINPEYLRVTEDDNSREAFSARSRERLKKRDAEKVKQEKLERKNRVYIKPYCPLKSIEFLEEFRCFNKGEKYEFRSGINFLVGDQGCGKSTMLQALMEYQNRRDEFNVVVLPTEFYFLDTEKHNPRVADNQILGHMDMRDMLMSRWKSHGESFMPRLLSFKQAKNVMFFIDEPEAALSIRSQIRVTQALKKASEYNQFVISTHSEILIRLVDQVLDLETKQWVDTEVFLKNQRNLKFKIKS